MGTPAIPAPTAPFLVTEHGQEDRMRNKLAAAMMANQPQPVPATPATPAPAVQTLAPGSPEQLLADVNQQITQPASPATPATPATPAAPAQTPAPAAEPIAAPAGVDLNEIDFDSPAEEPAPTTTEPGLRTPATTPNAEIETELTKLLADGAIPEKIEEVFLKHGRGRQMLAGYKRDRDLAKPPAEGGIGRIPDAEYIKAADQSHRTMTAMMHEIEADPVSFVSNLITINPDTGTSFLGGPERVQQFLSTLPEVLFAAARQTGSPVYSQLVNAYSTPVFSNFFNHQYQKALAMPQSTPQQIEDKTRVIDALQISEFQAFGKARPLNLGTAPQNGAPAQAPDPQVAELQARLRNYEQQIRNSQQQNFNTAVQRVTSDARSAALSDIDRVLSKTGVKSVYSAALLNPLRETLYNEVSNTLQTADPNGWQQYRIQVQQAATGKLDPAAVAKTYRTLFQNALRNSPQVREQLNELVRGAKSHSDAQLANRQESQTRTEPNGAGSSVRTSVLPSQQLQRQPGESSADFNTRRIIAASQSVVK